MPKFLLVATALAAMLLAACGGGDEETPAGSGSPSQSACARDLSNIVFTPQQGDYRPIIASSDLAVGENRFVAGLLDKDGAPVTGGALRFRFYCFTESGDHIDKTETDAVALSITRSVTHTHDDGTVETHEAGDLGVHVANVGFDAAGKWGVEVSGAVDGEPIVTQSVTFSVREQSLSPAVGAPAPRSVQQTLADVADIRDLDTSAVPIPEMHDKTIAEAVTSGKPTVIIFGTPAFCVSQLCGPAKEIVDGLYEHYSSHANFVHVEPYFLEEARSGKGLCPVAIMNVEYAAAPSDGCPTIPAAELPPADQSWNLSTEPWVFIVDKDGNVAAKFESAFGEQELEDSLRAVLAP